MKQLVMPQISINGTSKNQLREQQLAVLEAFQHLLHAMEQAMPHGRDYQFRPEEYQPARDAWLERYKAIQALNSEISEHAILVANL